MTPTSSPANRNRYEKPGQITPEQELLVTENMRLAHYMANRAMDCDPAEALSRAMEGLMEAALRWESARGIPFGKFAAQRIRWTIGLIRIERRRVKRGGRAVIFSCDAPVSFETETSFLETIPDPAAEQADMRLRIESDLDTLEHDLDEQVSERDAQIVRARFGADGDGKRTLQSIALQHGMSRERVRQICSRVIARLHFLRALREPGVKGDQKKLIRSKTDQKHSSHLARYSTSRQRSAAA